MNDKKPRREEQSRLDSSLMLITCAVLLYAILLAFIQVMYASTETIEGAATFLGLLQWAGAIAAMASAAWSAYRDKKENLSYSAAAAFLFVSAFVVYRIGSPWGFYVNYAALMAVLVFAQAYGVMRGKNIWQKKHARAVYFALLFVAFAALAAVTAWRMLV
ncbi:MAG: hypothetical protein Q4C12_07465 [Clostridia bacterium]|nr:hypothetical protein [Clostridia bacterium]